MTAQVIDLAQYRAKRVKSILFAGAAITDERGRLFSPSLWLRFEHPLTAEAAARCYLDVAARGGFFAEEGWFVPWPPAAVRFEWVD